MFLGPVLEVRDQLPGLPCSGHEPREDLGQDGQIAVLVGMPGIEQTAQQRTPCVALDRWCGEDRLQPLELAVESGTEDPPRVVHTAHRGHEPLHEDRGALHTERRVLPGDRSDLGDRFSQAFGRQPRSLPAVCV